MTDILPFLKSLVSVSGLSGSETPVASINRWSSMGIQHFQKLGAEVSALRIIDRASANRFGGRGTCCIYENLNSCPS
jgi:hypothetical protein